MCIINELIALIIWRLKARRFNRRRLTRVVRAKYTFDEDQIQEIISKYPKFCRFKPKNDQDRSILQRICGFQPSLQLVRQVYMAYPEAIKMTDGANGWLPVHFACANKASTEVVRFLICKYPESIKKADNSEMLPVDLACRFNASLEVVQMLVTEYPDPVQVLDGESYSPFYWAAMYRASHVVVGYLLSENRNAVKEDSGPFFNLPALSQNWPLAWALMNGACPDTIRLLVSECPDILEPAHDRPEYRWQVAQKRDLASRAFLCSNDRVRPNQLLVSWYEDDRSAIEITNTIENEPHIQSIVVVGGGLHRHMVSFISKTLQENNTLLSLGLANNPIGDAGARSLAEMLPFNMHLKTLDIRDCEIGVVGLSGLLQSLRRNVALEELDLSYNTAIFSAHGGRVIAESLPKLLGIERLVLYRDEDGYSEGFMGFLAELTPAMRWNPACFRPVFLNRLLPHMLQAIQYYQGCIHGRILSAGPSTTSFVWHFVFEAINEAGRSNAELIFFYARLMLEMDGTYAMPGTCATELTQRNGVRFLKPHKRSDSIL